MVAPIKESIKEPSPPASDPNTSKGSKSVDQLRLHAEFSIPRQIARVRPIKKPPASEAIVPIADIAPFVPGGTRLSVVTMIGEDFDRIPNSEAKVSPRQHAKCPKVKSRRALLHPNVISADSGHHLSEL